jgi:hypothetical protein
VFGNNEQVMAKVITEATANIAEGIINNAAAIGLPVGAYAIHKQEHNSSDSENISG